MDQASTLRHLMSRKDGNPYAGLALYSHTQFLFPFLWKEGAFRILEALALLVVERSSKAILIVDSFDPEQGLERIAPKLFRVGAEKLAHRLDGEVAEVLGIDRIWSIHAYLESEQQLTYVQPACSTVLLQGATDAALVDSYRQLRTLSSRLGVKKVDALVLGECDLRDAVRAHARLDEMGNRFLQMDLGFLGNLKLNPSEILIHLKSGDGRRQLELIAHKFDSVRKS